jgi:hypothetical protein
MTPFNGYTIFQAERPQTEGERRMADARAGELAADFSRLRALLARPAQTLRGLAGARGTTTLTEKGKQRVLRRWL